MSTKNNDNAKKTEKLVKKILNRKALSYLPWVLVAILAIFAVKDITTVDLGYLTCGQDVINEFNTARQTFLLDKTNDNSKTAYKTAVDKISQKFNHQADPTCVYAKIKYSIDTNDYAKAQEDLKQLTTLYDQGKIADSRYFTVDSLEQIKSNVSADRSLVPATSLAEPQS